MLALPKCKTTDLVSEDCLHRHGNSQACTAGNTTGRGEARTLARQLRVEHLWRLRGWCLMHLQPRLLGVLHCACQGRPREHPFLRLKPGPQVWVSRPGASWRQQACIAFQGAASWIAALQVLCFIVKDLLLHLGHLRHHLLLVLGCCQHLLCGVRRLWLGGRLLGSGEGRLPSLTRCRLGL